ncbi:MULTISPECIES: CPXCG motif-containing cysteine-rich protein [Shewanella]|uniref:CPXCG motif-containing cysteine-rich protein n=2 Tax=Shewanella TaxID=22 RepID=A0A974XNZ0_9GAMM|nr:MULTISPECIES: CPXCG motif-containing cysteine-rich protein [Shewanella]QSX31844.1 CPXCG motif-containing cysteine-rich protein [Shewanella cyperi]QSX38916.1 CPXCG motif-containing cysteine-rich protein [Shewanella sedimentimangrovi]QSX42612.1 CPXCG motif-containing cysteine-rich protein [Shewanella cyperi]
MKVKTQTICCPHCGHHQHIDVDASGGDQDYYDDCRICCNPIHLRMHIDELHRKIELFVDGDDEQLY